MSSTSSGKYPESTGPPPGPPLVLGYESSDLGARILARRLRRFMLIAGCIASAAYIFWLFDPPMEMLNRLIGFDNMGLIGTPLLIPDGFKEERAYVADAAGLLALLILLQYLFLMPRGSLRIRTTIEGRPMKRAAIAAGFVAMLVSAGLVAALVEMPNWWQTICEHDNGLYYIWGVMAVMWGGWAIAFHRYWKSLDRYTALTRVMRFLMAGTVLEMLVSAPVQAFTHDRKECYCQRGSYTGLVLGLTAAVWLFGPGIVLLYARERRRRSPLLAPK